MICHIPIRCFTKQTISEEENFISISCHKLTKVSSWKERKAARNDRKGIYYIFLTFVYCFRNIIINLFLSIDFLIRIPFSFRCLFFESKWTKKYSWGIWWDFLMTDKTLEKFYLSSCDIFSSLFWWLFKMFSTEICKYTKQLTFYSQLAKKSFYIQKRLEYAKAKSQSS